MDELETENGEFSDAVGLEEPAGEQSHPEAMPDAGVTPDLENGSGESADHASNIDASDPNTDTIPDEEEVESGQKELTNGKNDTGDSNTNSIETHDPSTNNTNEEVGVEKPNEETGDSAAANSNEEVGVVNPSGSTSIYLDNEEKKEAAVESKIPRRMTRVSLWEGRAQITGWI